LVLAAQVLLAAMVGVQADQIQYFLVLLQPVAAAVLHLHQLLCKKVLLVDRVVVVAVVVAAVQVAQPLLPVKVTLAVLLEPVVVRLVAAGLVLLERLIVARLVARVELAYLIQSPDQLHIIRAVEVAGTTEVARVGLAGMVVVALRLLGQQHREQLELLILEVARVLLGTTIRTVWLAVRVL
jgi:hypothetical protein